MKIYLQNNIYQQLEHSREYRYIDAEYKTNKKLKRVNEEQKNNNNNNNNSKTFFKIRNDIIIN